MELEILGEEVQFRYAVCKLFIDPEDLNELVRTADRHDFVFFF